MSKLIEGLHTVSAYMNDAIDALDDQGFATALYNAAPWWGQAIAKSAGDAFPLIGFVLKIGKELTEEKDPGKQGYAACTLAYNRAVEQSVSAMTTKLSLKTDGWKKKQLTKSMPTDVDMSSFSFGDESISHPFVIHADEVFREFAEKTAISDANANRIINGIHARFLKNLRFILSHPKTSESFSAFKDSLQWNINDHLADRALEEHAELQSWIFNEAPVFGREPFALSHIYTDTDCGFVRYKDWKSGQDPNSESATSRTGLLETTMQLLSNTESKEPIVIWGAAGAGKSSFTLKLCTELIESGLRPIRVTLKDLDVSKNLLEALPAAVRVSDGRRAESGLEANLQSEWFKQLVNNNETVILKKKKISPYVLIFDGWDEISTGATTGFKDDVNRIMREIRAEFITPRAGTHRPKVGIIVTGRPSVDVTKTQLFEASTPILAVRPFTPTQLGACISSFCEARRQWPLQPPRADVTEKTFVRDPEWFSSVVEAYSTGFHEMLQSQERDNAPTEPVGTLGVMGLPLLTHLALRLMVELQDQKHLSELIESPTTLYRALVDMTYEKGAKHSDSEIENSFRYRLVGRDLRVLLWHAAAAITSTGEEHISREELRLRLDWEDDQLQDIVEEATKLFDGEDEKNEENVLAALIIGFFFKEGVKDQGCEFTHKSFREYLFAEGVVELLKDYGRDERVIEQYRKDAKKGFPERDVYWKDFDEEQDPRYLFTDRLAKLFATHWVSPEIRDHIRSLIEWEIRREESTEVVWPGKPTDGISLEKWMTIRDGLVDVWDWWAEGVLLRPKPIREKQRKTPGFITPSIVELTQLCSPLDPDRWKKEFPDVVRVTTIDARLGEAFFHLNAVTHSVIIDTSNKGVGLGRMEKASLRRRYQWTATSDSHTVVMFKPSGANTTYFYNFCARINASGWRPLGVFPSHVFARNLFLLEVEMRNCDLTNSDFTNSILLEAVLDGANLTSASLDHVDCRNASLTSAFCHGRGASCIGTDFQGARINNTNLSGSHFLGADFGGASVANSQFIDARFEKCDFALEVNEGNNFTDATGVPDEIRQEDR